MSYWKLTSKNSKIIDSFGLSSNHNTNNSNTMSEFYEMESGVVLDIVLDEKHPVFSENQYVNTKIDADRWPADLSNNKASKNDFDFSWIGRVLVRPLISEKMTDKEQLLWAYPIENNISEYPLINELVVLVKYGGKLYYSRKINYHNWTNNNLDFSADILPSQTKNKILFSNTVLSGSKESLIKSNTSEILANNSGYHGYAGNYFVANNKIRTVKRFEGDLLIESRHGQSIHMTAYDSNRKNDIGDSKNKDYTDGGNPMILIRNRQRTLLRESQSLSLHNSKNKATIYGTKVEKNVGGYLEENINHDGSSIHITSGQTISQWVTTCYKKMFGTGEEVPKFNGNNQFKYPILNGDQIIIQSDRLILSSRYGETFHYSKKRYGIVTDSDYIVDSHDEIVLTTHVKAVINSPAIYLGEYDQTNEPALLGQTTINWLYQLCNWMLEHTHWYKHSHEDAGKESPSQTQLPVQVQELSALRDKLHTLMSKRVFMTGGGFAPGKDGSSIPDGVPPTEISVGNGNGVPGGWKGKNFR